MSAFVGCDFDTRGIHLVKLAESGRAAYLYCPLKGFDAFERLRDVRRSMPGSSYFDDVIAIGIEEPQGVQKATVAKLKAVQGAIVGCIPRAKLVEPMVPARWRTSVGLHGHATKAEVAMFGASRGFMPVPPTQDAYDAWCLALAVSRLTEGVAA